MKVINKRPVVSFCIFMICGVVTASLTDSLLLIFGLAVFMAACFSLFGRLHEKGYFVPAGIIIFFLLGSLEFISIDRLQQNRFSEYDGKEVAVKGYVVTEPEINGDKVTYIIKVESVRKEYNGTFKKASGKILLSTLINKGNGIFDYGSEIKFEGVITRPGGVRNPGGFNYRRYLAQKGAGAAVFSYPYTIETGEALKGNWLVQAGLKVRNRIIYVIENSLPRQQAGLLNGMLIGYREGLSEEVQEAFSNAGLTHIMAVSGANVAFLILPVAFLFKRLRIRKTVANLLIITFLFFFVFITGFEPSVLRAVVMAAILLVAAIIYREPDTYTAIAFSCILLLTASPYMLFNIGFQLSYAATLSLVMLSKNIKQLLTKIKIPGKIADILAVTLAAQIGVLPITMIYFNKVSIISIIPNLLAVPMLEFITILGTLMALLGQFNLLLSQIIGYFNVIFLSAVLYITKVTSSLSFATVKTVTPPIILAAAYYIVIWFLLWYRPLKNITLNIRHAAAVLSFAAIFVFADYLKPETLEVVFLDVGQGDSAFIRTYTGKTVLIDGGGSSDPSRKSKTGETVIIPFLFDSAASRLDAVIATHSHSDHTQGLENVLEEMKVNSLIIPSVSDEGGFKELLQLAGNEKVPVTRCFKGETIRLDDRTVFQVLSPEQNCNIEGDSLNNTSLVLKLIYGQTEILFTGDAEAVVEDELVAGSRDLSADIIKLAHHGSNTSTGKAFLDKVNPQAAIISVGKNNFGHPSPETLELLENRNLAYFRTDECGAVILKSDGRTVKIKRTVKEKASVNK